MAVDVVTADGELVRADASQNSDLYWAARGAGPGFFGVVTRFHLRTLPAPGHVAQTVHAYSLDDFDEVMTWLHGTHASVADTVEIVALTKTDPSLGPGPRAAGHRRRAGRRRRRGPRGAGPLPRLPRAGPRAAGRRRRPHDARRSSARASCSTTPRATAGRSTTRGSPVPVEDVLPAMRRAYTTLPTAKSFTIWFSMAPLRALPDMAFSVQSEIYLASYVVWEDPAEDDAHRAWLAGAMADLEPVTVGQYLGDSDLAHRQVRVLSDEAWARLEEIRGRRDPDGVFVGHLAGPGGATNRNHWE